jgi:predicted PurR-regulated permease PerM
MMLLSRKVLNVMLILGLLGFLAWFFSNIVTYFVVAFVIASVLKVPTEYFCQLHLAGLRMPRLVAVLMSFSILLGIVALFALLFIPLFSAQIKILAFNDFSDLLVKIDKPVSAIEKILIDNHFLKREEGFLVGAINTRVNNFFDSIQFEKIIPNLLSTATNILIGILMVTMITLFTLAEKGLFRRNITSLIPNRYFEVTINAMYKIEKLMSNYLLALLLQMMSIFTTTSLGLILAGVDYAITIGLLAALINIVPFVGPITSASFGLFVAISTSTLDINNSEIFMFLVIKVLTVFGCVQFIDAFIMQPIIFSKSVKAHPLEIFVMIFVGSTLAGTLGMVLAVPVYTICKVIFIEMRKGYKTYKVFKL